MNLTSLLQINKRWTKDDFVFFWGHTEKGNAPTKACLSQWYPVEFYVDGIRYNCAEQYMMAEKARLFKDEEIRHRILMEADQMAIKKLGHQVNGYVDDVWQKHRSQVIFRGNLAKFSQNESLKTFLLSTGNKVLVEANPKDTIWGIGLDEFNPDAVCPDRWRGTNLLGFALMEVRKALNTGVMKTRVANKRLTPDFVTELSRCEVFVFGSNLQGMHGGGAARIAMEKFGAVWEEGDGPTGQCYAMPTMHGGIEAIRPYAEKFIRYAKEHPMQCFLLTRVGCGIAGFRDKDMAPLFAEALDMPNITVPREWLPYMTVDYTLGFKTPRGRDEAPKVVTDEILRKLCNKYLYEIGAGIGEHLPEVRIRYVRDTDDFGYTGLENCFFFDDGGMYVWETDDKWKEDHNQDIVEDVFGDECRGRGFAHRVIFAGVGTGVIDSNGEEIYTGDVLSVNFEDHTLEMALGQSKETIASSLTTTVFSCVNAEARTSLASEPFSSSLTHANIPYQA